MIGQGKPSFKQATTKRVSNIRHKANILLRKSMAYMAVKASGIDKKIIERENKDYDTGKISRTPIDKYSQLATMFASFGLR